jgi:4-hydroxybenzoate polyprenyltransferase
VRTLVDRALVYGRMIKFSHSVFALPFALASAAVAANGRVPWRELPWIVVAMIGARSAAMGFNRLADQAIDARNPRTAGRELPRGVLSRGEVWMFVGVSALALIGAAAMLNPLCLLLSPVALLVVMGYSYTKRFTSLSHLVLGLALSIAPVGRLAGGARPVRRGAGLSRPGRSLLGGRLRHHLFLPGRRLRPARRASLPPALLGIARALTVSRVLHVAAVILLAALYTRAPLHPVYLVGVGAVATLLVYEHSLVSADDLSRVDAAFFTVNGWISVGYLAFTVLALRLA